MAADVDAALLQMLEHEGHMTAEEALAFKSAMKDNGRLHREIYM
jgi:sulfite reductase alpha subunit-like flavoprotein